MKIIHAKCKFCGQALRLNIDTNCPNSEELIELGSCNHCADAKTKMWKAKDDIRLSVGSLAGKVLSLSNAKSNKLKESIEIEIRKLKTLIENGLIQYCNACRYFNRANASVFELSMVEAILDNLDHWWVVLDKIDSLSRPNEPNLKL